MLHSVGHSQLPGGISSFGHRGAIYARREEFLPIAPGGLQANQLP